MGLVYTMNASQQMHEQNYAPRLADFKRILSVFNGEMRELAAYNTLQVANYSKFNMAGFNEADKKLSHEEQFPKDLDAAFRMGAELCS